MGTRTDKPATDDVTELDELLDAPETPEEKKVLDELMRDPDEVLQRVKERIRLRMGGRPLPPPKP